MKKHYNIYYLFLEDKNAHPLPPKKKKNILKNIKKALKICKPP